MEVRRSGNSASKMLQEFQNHRLKSSEYKEGLKKGSAKKMVQRMHRSLAELDGLHEGADGEKSGWYIYGLILATTDQKSHNEFLSRPTLLSHTMRHRLLTHHRVLCGASEASEQPIG